MCACLFTSDSSPILSPPPPVFCLCQFVPVVLAEAMFYWWRKGQWWHTEVEVAAFGEVCSITMSCMFFARFVVSECCVSDSPNQELSDTITVSLACPPPPHPPDPFLIRLLVTGEVERVDVFLFSLFTAGTVCMSSE